MWSGFEESLKDLAEIADSYPRPEHLGKADWIWDEDLGCHIPCCSREKTTHLGWLPRCGSGPLVGEQIAAGDCGEH